MDPTEVGWLYRSYMRRKKFEADLLANTIAQAFSVMLGGKPAASAPAPAGRDRARPTPAAATPDRQSVPAHQFFKILESR